MTLSNMSALSGMQQQQGPSRVQGTEEAKPPRGPKPEAEGSRPEKASSDTYVPSAEAQAFLEAQAATEEVAEEVAEETVDETVVEDSTSDEVSGSGTKGPNKELVNALKADLAMNQQKFVDSMVSMITGQAASSTGMTSIWEDYAVTEEVQAEAQEAISEDGYWGVEQTATRIVDMAKALAGDDPAMADELMSAIEKGFEAAEKVWGSELPSITGDTKTRIDEMFAEWKES